MCVHRVSIFLHPFAPQALPCFVATMNALTPARHSRTGQVSLLTCCTFRPFRPQPPLVAPKTRSGFSLQAYRVPPPSRCTPLKGSLASWASPLSSRLATTTGRNRFALLRTGRSPPVAPHPASWRRSYLRLRSSDRASAGTSTLRIHHDHRRTRSEFIPIRRKQTRMNSGLHSLRLRRAPSSLLPVVVDCLLGLTAVAALPR